MCAHIVIGSFGINAEEPICNNGLYVVCVRCYCHFYCWHHRHLWTALLATVEKLHILYMAEFTHLVHAQEIMGQYNISLMAVIFLFCCTNLSRLYKCAFVPGLSTQKEQGHCDLYSLIYVHFCDT